MSQTVAMPEMGEGVLEGTISRWLKAEGDSIAEYEPLVEVDTDKVTTEITAETSGVVLKIYVSEGETVPVGTPLADIGQPGESPAPSDGSSRQARPAAPPLPSSPAPAATRPTNGTEDGRQPYTGRISPVVGRIAAEHGVDLALVTGTGRDGRITKRDILAFLEDRPAETAVPAAETRAAALAPSTSTAPAVAAMPGDVQPLNGMRRAIAEHMVRSKQTSPHVTTVFEVDFSRVAAHRREQKEAFARDGANLTYTAYIIDAAVRALKAHPLVNSSWSDEGIVLHRGIHVGLAAAIEDGLIVPVVKNADSLNLLGMARVINDVTERARDGRLQPADVQGGTFTITNHGTSGSLFATPIINQPQCAILGVGKIEKRVVVIDDAIAIRPLAFVSLTFDHRILDGAEADAFVSHIKATVESYR